MFLRFYLIPVLFAFIAVSVDAQNLVPNGDFESYSNCPNNHSQVERAIGWESYSGTADYFNACDESDFVGTPLNETHGFQYPLSGDGYAGLIGIIYTNNREIMGIELSEPLTIGTDYYIEFYWSRTFGGVFHSNCNCASSHLGALLTTQPYHNVNDPISHNNFAHVYDSEVLIDSMNWNLISGWITADETYTHIAIGDFFDLDQNEIDFLDTNPNEIFLNTYYYIENVCLATDPAMCGLVSTSSITQEQLLEIYPNPSAKFINLKSSRKIISISVLDIHGKPVYVNELSAEQIDVSQLPSGIYFLIVKTKQGVQRRKFIKTP